MKKNKATQIKRSEEVIKNKPVTELSPSELMRSWHPDLFSDSSIKITPQLTEAILDHHLDTITRRKQENDFENFCRKLAEKEICPNLNPQTGPVGGGDSKVDTETYPVADEISLRWYEGIGLEASKERWAFAISAKQKWRDKVYSDVEKIIGTNRGYKVIFFITNQYVEDRTKAEVQDNLRQKHGVDVRILDRNWILKKVFENNRIQLVNDSLNITGYEKSIKEVGPLDNQRQNELSELEKNINDNERYKGVQYQLAEDCLQAALIARGLELPRVEVEGRFQRAERIAEHVGHCQQQLRVFYNHAWTEHWWFEDYKELNQLYDSVEKFAVGSIQADDLELVLNLWQILHTNVKVGIISSDEAKLDKRTKTLKAELERISKNLQRPNNALQARTNRILLDISESLASAKPIDKALKKLIKAFRESEGLTEYPITAITQVIQELGKVLPENKTYDNLVDVVEEITKKRSSLGEAGKIRLVRGLQKLNSHQKYDAIRFLGKAQQMLAMDEYESAWVRSTLGIGLAYEQAGLFWAARSNFLMAANRSFSEYVKHGKLVPETILFLQNLIWIELQIGRIPQVLEWMDAARTLANVTKLDKSHYEKYDSERTIQSVVLGILFLKADMWSLKLFDFLPPVLEQADLIQSWMALLYALGYEDYLRSNKLIPDEMTPDEVRKLYVDLLNQPIEFEIPDSPELCASEKVSLKSNILGCNIIVETPNDHPTIYLGEMILGALESFLATSLDSEVLPFRSDFRIIISQTEFIIGLPQIQFDEESGGQSVYVRCSKYMKRTTIEERKEFKNWLARLIIDLATHFIIISDPESFLSNLVGDEKGMDRAIIFSDIDTAIENLLGKKPKFILSDWKQKDYQLFPLQRELPWNYGVKVKTSDNEVTKPVKFGDNEPPAHLFDTDKLKHRDRKVISIINIPLWDKAKWSAMGFL